MSSATSNELSALLEPGVTALGFELVAIELSGSGRDTVLRVYIDSPQGINVDDCADVSHQVSAILDVEDPLPGEYTLEVSSPGLDRPLVKTADFASRIGETIKVRMALPLHGRRNFKGRLVQVDGDHIVIRSADEDFDLTISGMERARLVPKF